MTEILNNEDKNKSIDTDFLNILSRDVIYYIPVKLLPAINGLLSIYILTRILTPNEYGTYSVVITSALLLTQLSSSWITSSVLFVYPDFHNNKYLFQQYVIKIQVLVVIPAALIIYVMLLFLTQKHTLALAGTLIMALQIFQGLFQTFLQSTREVISQAVSVGVQSITQLGILYTLVFVLQGKELAALIAISTGYSAGIAVLLLQGKVSWTTSNSSNSIDFKELLNRLYKYGLPMCIWFFATQFYTIGDRLLLKMFNVTDTLGQYASFRDLATGCAGFLTMPLLMASHPIIMTMWKERRDRTEIEQLISRNMTLLTLMFIPLMVLIDICGQVLVTPILGQKYQLDNHVMLAIIGSLYVCCMAIYIQKGLEVTGNTLVMAKIATVVAFLSLLANLFIVKLFGVIGSSMMVLISSVIYFYIARFYSFKFLSPRLPKFFVISILVWVVTLKAICSQTDFIVSSNVHINKYIDVIIILLSSFSLFLFWVRKMRYIRF